MMCENTSKYCKKKIPQMHTICENIGKFFDTMHVSACRYCKKSRKNIKTISMHSLHKNIRLDKKQKNSIKDLSDSQKFVIPTSLYSGKSARYHYFLIFQL